MKVKSELEDLRQHKSKLQADLAARAQGEKKNGSISDLPCRGVYNVIDLISPRSSSSSLVVFP